MGRKSWFGKWDNEWTLPMFIVLAILALWLSLTYLPLDTWGITFESGTLWNWMPWIAVFAIGLFGLKKLVWK